MSCLYILHTQIFLSGGNTRSQAVARRSKRVQKGTESTIAGIAATSGGTSLLLHFVTTHCLYTVCGHGQLTTHHQRRNPCPPTTSPLTLCSHCAFILKILSEFTVVKPNCQIKNSFRGLDNCSAIQLGIQPDCLEWRYSISELLCALILHVMSILRLKCQWWILPAQSALQSCVKTF